MRSYERKRDLGSHTRGSFLLLRFISPVIAAPWVMLFALGLYYIAFPALANCVEIGLPALIILVLLFMRSGYEVYLLETPYKDPVGCAARNLHGFTLDDIKKMAADWEQAPHWLLPARGKQ